MKRDRIDDILQKKLNDFTIKAPREDWRAIEKELGISPKSGNFGIIKFSAVAASFTIFLMTGIYFFSRTEPFATIVEDVVTLNRLYENPSVDNVSALEAVVTLKNSLKQTHSPEKPTAVLLRAYDGDTHSMPFDEILAAEQAPSGESDRTEEPTATGSSEGPRTAGPRPIRPNLNWNPDLDKGKRTRSSSGPWSLSLYADGSTSMGSAGGSSNSLLRSNLLEFSVAGMNSSTDSRESASFNHNIPLTFGLTFHKQLYGRWGVESGLIYTYHSARRETTSVKEKQTLHYLGIPVSVTFTAYQNQSKTFQLYAKAGVAVDFNLYGEQVTRFSTNNDYRSSRTVTGNGVIFSSSAHVGAMYQLGSVVGLYFEPGIGYYLKNNSQPESYWTDHPFNFNMKLGIRTTF